MNAGGMRASRTKIAMRTGAKAYGESMDAIKLCRVVNFGIE